MNSAVLGIFSAVVAILCGRAVSQPVKYDQRQEGDLNVRTDVEDVVFVVVPPQDLISAGMGLVAATAADLLRKNYGGIGPERWPLRTTSKVVSVPLEKSPYKVDLEKSGVKLKKISHVGDPNRYSIQDVSQPMKAATETKTPGSAAMPEKPEMVNKVVEETQATENKTVKKALKPEETEKESMEDEDKKKAMEDEDKKKAMEAQTATKSEETTAMTTEKAAEDTLKVVGEGSRDGLDPGSILRIEGCGPDARRDSSGKCVFKN